MSVHQSYQHLHLAIRESLYNNQAQGDLVKFLLNLVIRTWKDWFDFRELSTESWRFV